MKENIRHNIGDEVIALKSNVTNLQQYRIKGEKYIVKDIMYCSKCGLQMINIGQTTNLLNVKCGECHHTSSTNFLMWTCSKLFIKVDNISEMLEEAIHNEDYELASLLRDSKK